MSILTKKQILERIESGSIKIEPSLDIFQLQAHAIDLRLGHRFLVPRQWKLTDKGRVGIEFNYMDKDSKNDNFEVVELEKGQVFELLPGEHVLASTLETITWPNDVMSVLYPRSSTNRRCLSVDLTGIVDTGYSGQLIIPVRNNTHTQKITLYPGERFCQITFEELSEPSLKEEGTYHKRDMSDGFIIQDKYNDEMQLIKEGDVSKIKTDFKVDLDK